MESGADTEGRPAEPSDKEPSRATRRRWFRIGAAGLVGIVLIAALAVSLRPANAGPTITWAVVSTDSTSVGTPLSFEGLAADPDRDALTYSWDFGDGSTATGENATHAYSLPGRFVAVLTVADAKGAKATNDAPSLFIEVRPRPSEVAPPPPPTSGACPLGCTTGPAMARLAADQTTVVARTLVRFTANASWAYTWSWNNVSNHSEGGAATPVSAADDPSLFTTLTYGWGDGSPNTGGDSASIGTTSHRFSSPGNYFVTVTLTVPTIAGTLPVSAGYTVRVTATEPPTATVKRPQTFTQVTFGEPETLDPAADAETSGGEVLQNVYETLVWYQRGTENVTVLVPRLALELPTEANGGISADGKNYTFSLRPNVRFHSGGTMTPEDVAYSIQRVLASHDPRGPSWILEQVLTNFVARHVDACGPSGGEPCTLANYTDQAFPSREAIPPNIRAVLEGVAPATEWTNRSLNQTVAWAISNSTVEVVGANQVTVHLTRPYPAFLHAMASTVGSIVQKSCAIGRDGWATRNDFLDRQGDCGTGPYKLRWWVPNVAIRLTRFDDYWGGRAPISEVHVEKVNDVLTREFMLLAGDADAAHITRDRQLDLGTADGTPRYATLRIVKNRTFDVTVFGYNQAINASTSPDPLQVPTTFFADLHVRRAFSYAFDYNGFLRNVTHDTGFALRGPIAQGIPGYNMSTPVFTYNLSRAAAELQMTPFWTTGFSLTLYYNAGNTERREGCLLLRAGLEALHTQWGAGPISVTVRGLEWPAYLRAFRAQGLPIFFLGWRPDYPDPDDYVVPFLRSDGVFASRIGYVNRTLDRLIDTAAAELNWTTRVKMYQDLTSRAVIDDVPYLWVYQSWSFHIERTWVRGYYFHPMLSGLDYHRLSKVAA